jgi:glycosyltransferase involved in cell wall biosynthesis
MLHRAITSVLSQTFPDWELWIVDDCSTSETEVIVNQFEDSRIHYYRRDKNSEHRLGEVKNSVKDKVTGQYVTFLDDDNYYQPDFLEAMVDRIENIGEEKVIYCDSIYWEEERQGEIISGATRKGVIRSQNFDRELIKLGNYIDLGEIIAKKEWLDEVGWFDETIQYCGEDWEVFLRLIAGAREFYHYSVPLTNYWVHATQGTKNQNHLNTINNIRQKIANGEYY